MHSHERTMLAKLGFADPDRRDAVHDLASRYLTTQPVIHRLVSHLGIETGPKASQFQNGYVLERCETSLRIVSCSVNLEQEIAKGYGQYRTTVGFIDLVLNLEIDEQFTNVMRKSRCDQARSALAEWEPAEDYAYHSSQQYGIEVKATPTSLGDLIRQMNVYRAYSHITRWIVATTYPLAGHDLDCLKAQKLLHVQLGAHFQAYVEEQQSCGSVANLEV